jgi:1-acyl-sn-glycerol-3-phosphate acyltransferase
MRCQGRASQWSSWDPWNGPRLNRLDRLSVHFSERIWRESLWQFSSNSMRLLFGMKAQIRVVYYQEIPREGGFILASNHISHFDPPIITPLFPRRIDWIGMSDLFRGRILRGIFMDLNVIPIARNEPDRAALRIAVQRLRQGRVVGIFPEGGIRDGDRSIINGAPMKQGLTLLSMLARAPIVPCVILGSDRLYNLRNWLPWRRPQIWIGCGNSIPPPLEAGTKAKDFAREMFSSEVVKLKERLYEDFGLKSADLPHPPKVRMKEP